MNAEELLQYVWLEEMRGKGPAYTGYPLDMPHLLVFEQAYGQLIIQLADGHYGTVIRYYPDHLGVQVPDAPNITDVPLEQIRHMSRNFLAQVLSSDSHIQGV